MDELELPLNIMCETCYGKGYMRYYKNTSFDKGLYDFNCLKCNGLGHIKLDTLELEDK